MRGLVLTMLLSVPTLSFGFGHYCQKLIEAKGACFEEISRLSHEASKQSDWKNVKVFIDQIQEIHAVNTLINNACPKLMDRSIDRPKLGLCEALKIAKKAGEAELSRLSNRRREQSKRRRQYKKISRR